MAENQDIERVLDEDGDDVLNENDTCTEAEIEEAVGAFMLGDITLAQLEGISAEEMYAIADVGYDLLEEGKIDDAQKIFEGLNAYNPMDSYFHNALGSIYQRQERLNDAILHFASAVELYAEDISAWTNLGECLLNRATELQQEGETERAADAFESAVAALSKAIEPPSEWPNRIVGPTSSTFSSAGNSRKASRCR